MTEYNAGTAVVTTTLRFMENGGSDRIGRGRAAAFSSGHEMKSSLGQECSQGQEHNQGQERSQGQWKT